VTWDGAVAIIRLNRPKQLNALNAELAAAMIAVVQSLGVDPEISCLLITENERAFAAGANIAERASLPDGATL
jgi:enoyl-CoA hydratase